MSTPLTSADMPARDAGRWTSKPPGESASPKAMKTTKSAATRSRSRSETTKPGRSLAGRGRGKTKRAQILGLLQRPKGASVADLTKATGWQPHSIRAALTGIRKQGHDVVRFEDARGTGRYRVGAS